MYGDRITRYERVGYRFLVKKLGLAIIWAAMFTLTILGLAVMFENQATAQMEYQMIHSVIPQH